ncbi:MAG: hypothetical protein J6K43_07395 [Lachnospiraceae bacterium]|nr:hypothetical protein [Lachnospiraceae bacterium]
MTMLTETKEKTTINNKPTHPTLLKNIQYGSIIALCFLWTATGYLSWMYNLLELTSTASVDWLTEVIGYIFQALGLLCFSILLNHNHRLSRWFALAL